MSEGSDYTLCPSNRSESTFRLIRRAMSQSSEKSTTTKFVKYINPAAYIERNIEATDRDFSDDEMNDDNNTLDDVENIDSSFEVVSSPREVVSKMTVCKIEDNNEMALERQRRYEEWLRNKRRQARDRRLQSKALSEREEREIELKRQISREKVLEWMSKKTHSPTSSKNSESDGSSNKVKTLIVKHKTDKELNFDAWLKKKEKQEIEDHHRQKLTSTFQAQYENYRKLLSTAFYDKWTTLSHGKPRPVPLNQGFASLAGSVSHLYVNPQPWNHI